MLELEVLVCKGFRAEGGRRAGAVAVEKVAALDHKVLDLDSVSVAGLALGYSDVRRGGTCSSCSLAAGLGRFWSRRCRTGESSPPSLA